jgi:hypothetical protein
MLIKKDRTPSMLTKIQSSLLKRLLSTKPADRPRAEAALAAIYPIILKRPAPKHFFWFDSPERAGWAVKLLDAVQERMWAGFVELESRRSERRQFLWRSILVGLWVVGRGSRVQGQGQGPGTA